MITFGIPKFKAPISNMNVEEPAEAQNNQDQSWIVGRKLSRVSTQLNILCIPNMKTLNFKMDIPGAPEDKTLLMELENQSSLVSNSVVDAITGTEVYDHLGGR